MSASSGDSRHLESPGTCEISVLSGDFNRQISKIYFPIPYVFQVINSNFQFQLNLACAKLQLNPLDLWCVTKNVTC